MISHLLSWKQSAGFSRNLIYLIAANAFAQFLPFIVLPFLQYYFYGPDDFGRLLLFITVSELFISVASLKYEYGIVLEKRLKDRVNLLFLAGGLVLVFSLFTLLLISILCFLNVRIDTIEKLGGYVFLIPLSVFCYGLFECLNYWFNREKKYSVIAAGKGLVAVGAESVKVICGFGRLNNSGLIIGRVAGQLAGMLTMAGIFLKRSRKSLKLISPEHAGRLLSKHKRFALYTTPGVLTGVLINFVYVQMFLAYYGISSIGIMSVSVSYVSTAFAIISVSYGQIFYRHIAEITDMVQLRKVFLINAGLLFILAMLVCGVVFLVPDSMVVSFLGEKWSGMMNVMRIMVLWIAVSFVISSLSFIYVRLGRQKEMLIMDIFHLLLVVVSIYIAHSLKHDFLFTLKVFAAAQIFYYVSAFTLAYYFLKHSSTR